MILLPSCLEVQLQYFPLPSSKSVPSTRADYHQRFRAIGGPFARCLVTPIICSSHSISFLPSFLSFLPSLSCKSIIDIAHHPAADRWSDRSIDRLTRVHLASKLAQGSWARRNWEK